MAVGLGGVPWLLGSIKAVTGERLVASWTVAGGFGASGLYILSGGVCGLAGWCASHD
jgi:hypothetical protein